jgi:hypothetical protein
MLTSQGLKLFYLPSRGKTGHPCPGQQESHVEEAGGTAKGTISKV